MSGRRSSLSALALLAALVGGVAHAQSDPQTVLAPESPRTGGGEPTRARRAPSSAGIDGPRAVAWIDARISAARRGHADLVQLPVAMASLGWGCTCPPSYVGWSPDVGDTPSWLELTLAPGVTLPEVGRRGAVWMLEGVLTGNVSRFEGDPGQLYSVREFVVTRLVAPHVSESPRMRLVREDAASCTSVVTDTTPLHVRERSSASSAVLGDLDPGTQVSIARVRGDWLSLGAPRTGWVYGPAVTTTCTLREAAPSAAP